MILFSSSPSQLLSLAFVILFFVISGSSWTPGVLQGSVDKAGELLCAFPRKFTWGAVAIPRLPGAVVQLPSLVLLTPLVTLHRPSSGSDEGWGAGAPLGHTSYLGLDSLRWRCFTYSMGLFLVGQHYLLWLWGWLGHSACGSCSLLTVFDISVACP